MHQLERQQVRYDVTTLYTYSMPCDQDRSTFCA